MENIILGVMIVGFAVVAFLASKRFDVGEIKETLEQFREKVDDDLGDRSGELKKDINDTLGTFNSIFNDNLRSFTSGQGEQIKQLQDGLKNQFDTFSNGQEKQSKQLTEEVSKQIFVLNQTIDQLKTVHSGSMKDLQSLVNNELEKVRRDNDEKLEKIRQSVDDQLESKLQKSVQQSFNSVLTQLQQVDKSLGEMQNVAKEVDGLRKIFFNVKLRGNFGEVQLESILDEIMRGRYNKQVMIRDGSKDRVDFTVDVPSDKKDSKTVLPIDSKFPMEAYERLQKAREDGDKRVIGQEVEKLATAVRREAKSINEKYIHQPKTTPFAVMFLAAESVYAEVISQPGLVEEIRKNYQVLITGPSTVIALLNTLQMGFQTLELTESAGKIGKVLTNTKREFAEFAKTLNTMKSHLNSTSKDLDSLINARTNSIIKALDEFKGEDELDCKTDIDMIEKKEDSFFGNSEEA